MSTSSFTLGYGLNYSVAAISAISMISFVSAFAIGLGPMPFVILAELPPPHARSAIASIGLATNWGLNICVVSRSYRSGSYRILKFSFSGVVLPSAVVAAVRRWEADGECVLFVWYHFVAGVDYAEEDVVVFCNRNLLQPKSQI